MSKVAPAVLAVLFIIAILGLALFLRWAAAGGDWSCVFSQDPTLCVVIKEHGGDY